MLLLQLEKELKNQGRVHLDYKSKIWKIAIITS